MLLKAKLNVQGADLCKHISDHNVCEMYRRLSCSYGPHAGGQDMALFDQANQIRDTVAKNFDETYLMLKKYDLLVKEYDRVTTGASIETRTKIWVVTHIIDKGTKLKMSVRPELRHGP